MNRQVSICCIHRCCHARPARRAGHGRPCWLTTWRPVTCHLDPKGRGSVRLSSKHFCSPGEPESQCTAWPSLDGLRDPVRFGAQPAFSRTPLFPTQVSRGLRGRVLPASRPLREEPLSARRHVRGPGPAGAGHLPVRPGLHGRGLPALHRPPLLRVALLSERGHVPRAQPGGLRVRLPRRLHRYPGLGPRFLSSAGAFV